MYQRVLLKLSGASFKGEDSIFSFQFANHIIGQIKVLLQQKKQVIIVLGGGNIIRGRDFVNKLSPDSQFPLDHAGMMGTIINGLLLKELFHKHQIPVGLLSAIDVSAQVIQFYNFELAKKLLAKYGVLILVGGVGLSNFSTDFTAVLKAKELNADVILLGKYKTDGIYSTDPQNNSQAQWIPKLSFDEVVKKNLQFMDISAAAFNINEKVDLIVFDINTPNSVLNVLEHKGRYSIVTNS